MSDDQNFYQRLSALYDNERETLYTSLVEDGSGVGVCESPVENLLAAAFCLTRMRNSGNMGRGIVLLGWHEHEARFSFQEFMGVATGDRFIYIAPQVSIACYRVDFLCSCRVGGITDLLAVECDGHAFHERTKQQAQRDKARDRDLLTMGVPVMRFTGSEIWRDPMQAVQSVDEYFFDAACRRMFPDERSSRLAVKRDVP